MQRAFEKIIERLEERKKELEQITAKCTVTQKLRDTNYGYFSAISHAQEIVNQIASEYDGGMPATCNDVLATIEKIKDIIREEEHFEVSNSIEIPHPNKADYDAVHAEKFNRIWKIISEAEEQTQLRYQDMKNSEIRNISYEKCPLKCTGCESLCNEMPVGQCRENLSIAFDDKESGR